MREELTTTRILYPVYILVAAVAVYLAAYYLIVFPFHGKVAWETHQQMTDAWTALLLIFLFVPAIEIGVRKAVEFYRNLL